VGTCTSETLARHLREAYRARGTVIAMPSTVHKDMFRVRDKEECRRALGLPENAKLIGTAGGLHGTKASRHCTRLMPSWPLTIQASTLSSPGRDKRLPPPKGPRVRYLGCLPHEQVAMLFSALDVGVIYLRDSPFGRFCFPQKAYEMAGCGLPIVAAAVGDMRHLLANHPKSLYRPDDAGDLAESVREQLQAPQVPEVQIDDWRTIVSELEPALYGLVGNGPVRVEPSPLNAGARVCR
jgi:teichuronic acid biosynthesis glycosyltransferase TuaC